MKNHKLKLRAYINEERERSISGIRDRMVSLKSDSDLVNDIVGPRRAGKTSLMKLEMKKLAEKVGFRNIIYINFENRKLYPLTSEYFNELIQIIYEEGILDKGKVYLFLDEVQRLNSWERYIRSIYDEFKGKVKLFISGSSSKLTEDKMSDLLSGRHLTNVVFPLHFKEFLYFNSISYSIPFSEENEALIKKALIDYLTIGGFPEIVLTRNEEMIETLFLDIINRDVASKVRNKAVLEDVAYFLCSNSSNLTSFSKLARILKNRGVKVSVPALERYFGLMKDAFLFFDNMIFSYKVKEQLQYPRKIYCIDSGFINYFGFKFSQDTGRMMENAVAVELYRNFKEHAKKRVFYFKNVQGEEVDFVVMDGLKVVELIQVCYDMGDDETKNREIRGMLKASKELRCNNLLFITWDKEGEEEIEWFGINRTVRFIPLWKWLLSHS